MIKCDTQGRKMEEGILKKVRYLQWIDNDVIYSVFHKTTRNCVIFFKMKTENDEN